MDKKQFERRMTIMFSNFMENINWQVQDTNRTPRRINTKRSVPRSSTVKLLEGGERTRTVLNAASEKQLHTNRGTACVYRNN